MPKPIFYQENWGGDAKEILSKVAILLPSPFPLV